MKKNHIISIVLLVMILLPIGINLFGWNIYTYIQFGNRDFVCANGCGLSHWAWTEHYPELWGDEIETEISGPFVAEFPIVDILKFGRIYMFAEERLDPMRPISFSSSHEDEYFYHRSLEFPQLLYLIVPILISGWMLIKKKQNQAWTLRGKTHNFHA
jgi:hypothetical protein